MVKAERRERECIGSASMNHPKVVRPAAATSFILTEVKAAESVAPQVPDSRFG